MSPFNNKWEERGRQNTKNVNRDYVKENVKPEININFLTGSESM